MKTLLKYTPKKTTVPILSQICVKDGMAMTTDMDYVLSVPVIAANGLYNREGFNTQFSKLESDYISEFPILPEFKARETLEYSRLWLLERLELLKVAMNDSTRPQLRSVCFNGADIVSTNGHTLHLVKNPHLIVGEYIIPDYAIHIMIDLMKEYKVENVTLVFGETRCRFICGEAKLVAKLVDASYPDYNRVIPDYSEYKKTEIDNAELKKLLPILKIIAKQRAEKLIAVKLHNGFLEYAGQKFPISTVTDTEIGFNFEYLLNMPSGEFYYDEAYAQSVIVSPLGLSIIMPMRI